MKCPRCHDRTEVLETRHREERTYRRRRCLSPHCQHRFTTNEANVTSLPPKPLPAPVENDALAAALAVDARRAAITREQRAQRRHDRSTWYETGFDPAPTELTDETVLKEVRGY